MIVSSNGLSVIVPAYNEEKNILKILQNLNEQTLSGFEVVVIDDGSQDNTASIVKNYTSSKYKLTLVQQQNMGAAQAREKAINAATSTYIAFVDCDDALSADALEQAIKPMLENDDIGISLFELIHTKSHVDLNRTSFKYYTDSTLIKGEDALTHCISSWGLHGFGIYKKKILTEAYNTYYKYNKDRINYINNDEIISRICFGMARLIFLSSGKYYFIHNLESTTRKVNINYYKVINNACYLKGYLAA
ncbi:glycosyltransferase family 2 protein, partial [Cronobacter sakazakii]|nr:glycosyltransferase family 2 protein [Cronobacter sakazakii]EMD9409136.1 glycosyltransferase family 2 protein [Cronobacter sakazakii]